jgi:hypothetical protein
MRNENTAVRTVDPTSSFLLSIQVNPVYLRHVTRVIGGSLLLTFLGIVHVTFSPPRKNFDPTRSDPPICHQRKHSPLSLKSS